MNRPVVLLTLLNFVAIGAGFAREAVTAFYFGTTAAADAFAVTLFYMEAVTVVVLYGLAGYMLVPIVTRLVGEGKPGEGFRLMETVLLWASALSLPLIVVSIAQPQVLAHVVAPDFSPAQSHILSSLLSLAMPGMLLVVMSGIMSGVLRARADYYSVVYGRVLFSSAIAATLFLVAGTSGIQAGAIGLIVGACAQLLLQALALWRQGWRPAVPRWRHPLLRQSIAAGLPGLLALLMTNVVMGSAQRIVASGLPEGTFAGMNYAMRSLSLISGLTLSLWTVSLTELSTHFNEQGLGLRTLNSLKEKLEGGLFLLTPLSFLLFAVSEPAIALLFQRGQYNTDSLRVTVECLRWLVIGVVPGMLVALLQGACPAFRQPWRAVIISFLWTLATIGMTALLLAPLQTAAMAAAYTAGLIIACLVSVLVLLDLLKVDFMLWIGKYLIRIVSLSAAAFVVTLIVSFLLPLPGPNDATTAASLWAIIKTTFVFGVSFVCVCAVTREPQLIVLAQSGYRFYVRFRTSAR